MPVRAPFDPKQPLVAARAFTFHGHDYSTGDPLPKIDDVRMARRLYETRAANFGDGKGNDPVKVEKGGGGWFTITAPWLDEPIKAKGQEAADAEAAKLREAGEPASHHGVTLTPGENGWFDVVPEWDAENPVKVHGALAALELATKMRADGKPADPVTVTAGNDKTIVTAIWLGEPEYFDTAEEADARAEALRAEGPPEGWTPLAA